MAAEYERRLAARLEELKGLFFSLYPNNTEALDGLMNTLMSAYRARSTALKKRDRAREA